MTSLRSWTRVRRHAVSCGRLAGGVGLGASPGASHFLPLCFLGWGGVLLRSAARRACVLLSCRVGRVFPGWRAWWVGWRYGRLLRIFSHAVRYLELLRHAVACAVRFAVRRFEGL